MTTDPADLAEAITLADTIETEAHFDAAIPRVEVMSGECISVFIWRLLKRRTPLMARPGPAAFIRKHRVAIAKHYTRGQP